MSIDYGWEKFFTCVSGLVTNDGPLQDRLADAFVCHLQKVAEVNVPKDVWKKLEDMKRAVTARPAVGYEGSIEPQLP